MVKIEEKYDLALELVAVRVAQRQAARSGRGRAGDVGDSIPLREVMAELAAAMRIGERTISSWLGDGAALVGAYPATLEALREGRIDERHASAIIDAGAPLDAGNRGVFEELILPVAEVDTAAAVREHARVIAARLQPEIVEARHREALAARQVKTYPLHDGLTRLLLDGPAALIQGVFERVTDLAAALAGDDSAGDGEGDEACGRDGQHRGDSDADGDAGGPDAGGPDACTPDERTLDQRRADVALDLLLTGAPTGHNDADDDGSALGAIRATVRVTVPILTVMGESDEPALLDGHGPIDADTARVLAAGASCWERVMIHPLTEEPLRLDTYRPSARLRRLLDARDQCCRWPGCRRPAVRSEADHTVAFSDGGKTHAGNLAILCKKHHRLKHASPWTITHLGGEVLEFTSPTRRRYRNNAPPVIHAATNRVKDPPWRRLLDAAYDSVGAPAPF